MLRDYQQEAVTAAVAAVATSKQPVLISHPTGAGKSHTLSALAAIWGRVLALAPTKELIAQNAAKYGLVADNGTVFCAGLNSKDATGQVVFGSPQSVRRSLDKMPVFDAVIVDEAHRGITEYDSIIQHLRQSNPDLIVAGLTATPYIIGADGRSGYIYQMRPDGTPLTDEDTLKPYYGHCVHEVTARQLMDRGWLTPPVLVPTGIEYDTSNLQLSMGRYSAESVDETFCGRRDLTTRVIRDAVRRSAGRKGIMVFAASVAHAREIMTLLPAGHAGLVTADTPAKDRDRIIQAYRLGMLRYIVNVSVLTTGFDVAHTDHIVIMRATESASLWQQIVGRATRLFPGKEDFLISDYAGNIERHFDDDRDLFDPLIRSRKYSVKKRIDVICPSCAFVNSFAAVPNPDQLEINPAGNFLDLAGQEVRFEGRPIPAHHGRRCQSRHEDCGMLIQCAHRWIGKVCKHCGADNDTAARQCSDCGAQLVDWNKHLEFVAGSRVFVVDDHGWKKARCVNAHVGEWWNGNKRLYRLELFVESRKTPVCKFFTPDSAEYRHFLDKARHGLPAFVLWKSVKGRNHPTIKLQWSANESQP